MQILAPSYYTKFKCIADRCTHSCCVGWEIDVDADTLEKYSALQGEMGERIRASLVQEGGGTHFALCADGRCPHLDGRGLCRIITALGEGYLCEICREHPRFYNEVAGHIECGLGLSCEEAARLCLQEDGYDKFILLSGTENGENGGTLQEFCTLPWREELMRMIPPSALGSRPCLMAFSTIAVLCLINGRMFVNMVPNQNISTGL